MSTRSEAIQSPDGAFDVHVSIPESGSGPGILLIHEIFGVNEYAKDAARRLSELGYVVLAPDLYWRTRPGLSLSHSGDDLQRAFAAVAKLDVVAATGDCITALAALRELPEVAKADRRAGVLGFCLGGTLAYQVAVHGEPDVAVCYYGAGIPDALSDAASIFCPMLMHWGGADPYISRDKVDAVAAMATGYENIECHVHEGAGHAFDNNFAPQFHNPVAADRAWEITSEFLNRTLPPG